MPDDHPNTNLFPDFSEWFSFLKSKKLRTYFNDHPFPVASRNAGGLQTCAKPTTVAWPRAEPPLPSRDEVCTRHTPVKVRIHLLTGLWRKWLSATRVSPSG